MKIRRADVLNVTDALDLEVVMTNYGDGDEWCFGFAGGPFQLMMFSSLMTDSAGYEEVIKLAAHVTQTTIGGVDIYRFPSIELVDDVT